MFPAVNVPADVKATVPASVVVQVTVNGPPETVPVVTVLVLPQFPKAVTTRLRNRFWLALAVLVMRIIMLLETFGIVIVLER